MSIVLLQQTKNTRGKDSRPISFMGIGREIKRTIQRETDLEGNPLTAKDAAGNLITRPEDVIEVTHEGVVTSIDDALELVNALPPVKDSEGNVIEPTQRMLDMFAFGYNKEAYQAEADKDELDPYVEGLDEAKAKARKSAIRMLAKSLEIPLLEAADIVQSAVQAA